MLDLCCLLLIGYAVVTGSICIIDGNIETCVMQTGGDDRRLAVKGLSPTCTGIVHNPRGC